MEKLIESLSPHERQIVPYLGEDVSTIVEKTSLDKVAVLRALEYLSNKKVLKLEVVKNKMVILGVNGILYKKNGLPERRFLNLLNEKRSVSISDAPKLAGLSSDEFKASLGALKKKAMIEMNNGKIILNANSLEVAKKSLEEIFLEKVPISYAELSPEDNFALKSLEKRRNIVDIEESSEVKIILTEIGKKLSKEKLGGDELIEVVSSNLLKSEKNWKGKKFRRYDVSSPVPAINGGKRHFVNQALDYARGVWTDLGFEEMSGDMVQSSFWNFDALFTAQDHPVREMQDTFFLNREMNLPDEDLVEAVKNCHERGVSGSKGWRYSWDESEAKKVCLRTHTTCLSARKLTQLKKEDLPKKFFSLGKNFRNETVDWSHGFEFYQTEGIVVDKNATFGHLLGYLRQFYKKMGFDEIRFRPAYFPYTEPSVEIDVWHPEKKVWLELGGGGMFRPEITVPLFGEHIPVLAWGQGFDRIIMDFYKIADLRDMYKNNLTKLRNTKFWITKGRT
ncbi:phenylalanine--tRNA ligase subunit alpha [Candidatus Pacearchaeota archaeon]|nr:phenylalanine--tRNA ligase subunit alpha [Candidatus Pacearchaeota archaeon]